MVNDSENRKEPTKALQAFEDYWSLGNERSLNNLVAYYKQSSGKPLASYQTLARWSSEFGWQERVRQRVQEEIEIARKEELKKLAEARRKRSKARFEAATALTNAGVLLLTRAKLQDVTNAKAARRMLPMAVRLIQTGIKNERLEAGESTENVQALTPPKPFEEMTDAELQDYIAKIEGSGIS